MQEVTGDDLWRVVLAIAAVVSACAAWYGAVVSRLNQKNIARQHKLSLKLSADHSIIRKQNGSRAIESEHIALRIHNRGRLVEIDSMVLDIPNTDTLIKGTYKRFVGYSGDKPLSVNSNETHVMRVPVKELATRESPIVNGRPKICLKLTDGKKVELRSGKLTSILRSLEEYRLDLQNGYELLMPQVMVGINGRYHGIEKYEDGKYPENAEFRYQSGYEGAPDEVPEEEIAVWKSGRHPQKERIDSARADKPKPTLFGKINGVIARIIEKTY